MFYTWNYAGSQSEITHSLDFPVPSTVSMTPECHKASFINISTVVWNT